jgi:hypothetical protein
MSARARVHKLVVRRLHRVPVRALCAHSLNVTNQLEKIAGGRAVVARVAVVADVVTHDRFAEEVAESVKQARGRLENSLRDSSIGCVCVCAGVCVVVVIVKAARRVV